RDAAPGPFHVAVDGLHLLAEERLEALAVRVLQRLDGLARRDVGPEARLGGDAGLGPYHEEDAADVGIPVEKHRPEHLAEEPRAPDDDEARPLEDAGDIESIFGRLCRVI